jgi:PIN domain nuclease of toxin-antitoxin system
VLELELLKEIGRLMVGAHVIIEDLRARIAIEVCDLAFPKVVASAREVSWTRDPFDRVIIGHAIAAGRPLLTKDRSIRRRFREAVW